MSERLQEGDVVQIDSGKVYATVPLHFAYSNRRGVFDEFTETEINLSADEWEWMRGRFVVTRTAMQGGGTAHGPHDVYPNGWHVRCERIAPPDRRVVSFYQSGSFTVMRPDLEATGKAKLRWEVSDE